MPDDQTVQTNGPGTRQIPEPGSGWIYPARPVVFVGMPCYEGVTAQAARGLYAPTSGGVLAKTTVVGQSSLAPVAFNGLLTHALNDRDSGLVSHFAMIHPDVDPCLAWLDILWHELRDSGAVLVSAVITIKDDLSDPFTSTAIGVRDDPWQIRRRIRISDRQSMPETFGPEHVCEDDEVLLVNTGLWLADLRHSFWDEFPGFNVHSRIVKTPAGRRVDVRPEDWELSRFLHAQGVRYVATWKPEVNHIGALSWPNREILGGRLKPAQPATECGMRITTHVEST